MSKDHLKQAHKMLQEELDSLDQHIKQMSSVLKEKTLRRNEVLKAMNEINKMLQE